MQASTKTALVTGASRGIGAAIAKKLAAEGYNVAVNSSTAASAEKLVAEITAAGGQAAVFPADIGSEAEIVSLFSAINKKFGSVTALVNNAAVNPRDGNGSVEELTAESLHRVLMVNIAGCFLCCREAVKQMREAGGGAIVNITSEAGKFGGNRMTPYASSKAAINTFTIGFAREAAPLGIRVNAVSPGVIDTHAHEGASEERLQHLNNSIPMGRMGTPEEVAEAVSWLLSEKSSYVSGAVIPVTGAR